MTERSVAAVEVQLFSVLKERMKSRSVRVMVSGPLTAGGLLDALCAEYPQLGPYRGLMVLAVNRAYARSEDPVRPGDEVAVITPVSGG
ncbi:MAG: MoaD/ThiS family protein [Bacteroidota bacterium]|nr:MoaD/ThiS family protein [Bacteroidota bacterium]